MKPWLHRLRIPWRFSLRTGLILFLLFGVGLGVLGRWVQNVRRRAAAQRRVIGECDPSNAAPTLTWARQTPSAPAFLKTPETNISWLTSQIRYWVDAEYGQSASTLVVDNRFLASESIRHDLASLFSVKEVIVEGIVPPEHLMTVFKIPGLKKIQFNGVLHGENPSTDWSSVRAATSLESINFSRNQVSDKFASELSKLPKLGQIHGAICSAEALVSLADLRSLQELSASAGASGLLTDAQKQRVPEDEARQYLHDRGVELFTRLARRKSLKILSLRAPLYLSRDDLTPFCQGAQLTELTLTETHLSPDCLAELAKLTKLKKLTLKEERIEDQNLAALSGAQQLQELDIEGNTSEEAIAQLRSELPNCTVNLLRAPLGKRGNNISAAKP